MAKQIMYDDVARRKAVAGVEKLAKAVKVTLGPAGKNVIIEKSFGGPQVTKDGVTVAKAIEFKDKFHNVGASLVKQVATATNDVAGDGKGRTHARARSSDPSDATGSALTSVAALQGQRARPCSRAPSSRRA